MPAGLIALSFAIASGIRIWSSMWGHDYSMAHPHFTAAFDNLIRLVAAVTFWRIAQCLARSRLLPTLKRVEPYVFLLFCSHIIILRGISPVAAKFFGAFGDPLRSEEHTSELQSLIRISYSVLCLQKKI